MDLKSILSGVPNSLVDELEKSYNEIVKNYREGRWEPSELNGGKLCEIVYTILRGHVDGNYPVSASKPTNMVVACNAMEKAGAHFNRSIRIQIPRMLIALYEVRNNRGVGHVGSDVDPNHMDALVVLHISKWVICELVRVFYGVSTEEATSIIEAISDRTIPLVWKIDGRNRILNASLSFKDKTLAILFSEPGAIKEEFLIDSIEHSNPTVYRRDILRPLHKQKLIEYDEKKKLLYLSPSGIAYVEQNISLTL